MHPALRGWREEQQRGMAPPPRSWCPTCPPPCCSRTRLQMADERLLGGGVGARGGHVWAAQRHRLQAKHLQRSAQHLRACSEGIAVTGRDGTEDAPRPTQPEAACSTCLSGHTCNNTPCNQPST